MAARPQPQLRGFVQCRFHDGGRRAEELDAVRAARRQLAHPFAALLRRVDRLDAVVQVGEHGMHHHARRRDLVGGGKLALLHRPTQAAHRAHFAYGRDPMRQPQFVDVVGGRDDAAHGVVRRANVRVRIDESGGDELAVAIDLVVAGARPAFRVDGLVRRAHVD
ncbi:hypothetical protein G6F22_018499 [Rhizopus arrhizus]|nr:hypothetical protein G6F22_018499 [Rhizopus arrhizus]